MTRDCLYDGGGIIDDDGGFVLVSNGDGSDCFSTCLESGCVQSDLGIGGCQDTCNN